jgi:hypothetical protein
MKTRQSCNPTALLNHLLKNASVAYRWPSILSDTTIQRQNRLGIAESGAGRMSVLTSTSVVSSRMEQKKLPKVGRTKFVCEELTTG